MHLSGLVAFGPIKRIENLDVEDQNGNLVVPYPVCRSISSLFEFLSIMLPYICRILVDTI